MKINHIVTKEE